MSKWTLLIHCSINALETFTHLFIYSLLKLGCTNTYHSKTKSHPVYFRIKVNVMLGAS